ncbi:type II toxin-antitoxin system HicA family toxin [Deinococcus multiflagellatus]|uniref:Type II toxin-antitoxin system HicA family toxin n=1 Tax=Deinococcus multiflagellatus TaxID=1656887 RepID=A0ABW1ZFZ2_9DEIO|nr:type II toxin-antitoxin system HicA family toxin [Deinococcus multiflagellatus]MBZ9712120.1 type II toxin-antitoxin system HicA family toxin [Deinococcus multiflagellatus]
MPRKLRELIRDLERAGFAEQSVRGSHRKFVRGPVAVILSGNLGDDVKPYQEKAVKAAIERDS